MVALPRVLRYRRQDGLDVPGDVRELAAAAVATPSFPTHFRFVSVPVKGKDSDTHDSLLPASQFSLFFRSVTGKTLVIGVDRSESLSQLCLRLPSITSVSCGPFYLTLQGKIMEESLTLERSGCSKHALICMRTRLRGWSQPLPVVPGSWTCTSCNLGGCWPARNTTRWQRSSAT